MSRCRDEVDGGNCSVFAQFVSAAKRASPHTAGGTGPAWERLAAA
jgi:hypothetical protein